jgi:F-type H+-transporting ATPase subunit b
LVIFFVLFAFLGRVYFAPFLKLFQERHQRTVADREAAEAMLSQANQKFAEYQEKLAEARLRARRELEEALSVGQREEHEILARARDEAKRLTQATLQEVETERTRLRAALDTDAESLAKAIVDHLMVKKG